MRGIRRGRGEHPAGAPALAALAAAELDDESLIEEDIAAIEEGGAAFRPGEDGTLKNVWRRPLGEGP